MPTEHRSLLAKIKTVEDLIVFLSEKMDWPIHGENLEDLTFEYTPEELGIKKHTAAKIRKIRSLRPLAINQPWGIFFVEFEPRYLPVVALRRILNSLAVKKHATANRADRPTWDTNDLLFVAIYGEGKQRHTTFAHFSSPRNSTKLPTLKVLGWDAQDTGLRLDYAAHQMTEHLVWPEDEYDANEWRKQWQRAFTLEHREVIVTARDLSTSLANLAATIRDRIRLALDIETETGRVKNIFKAFRQTLMHDLDHDGFADMMAQTIAYGLLSSRITDPKGSSASDFATHMRTNPLLRDLMASLVAVSADDGSSEIDFDELGISEVVELLDRANMEAVVRDFGDHNPREDPVIHFYERFLTEYDQAQRVKRGVFYTPRPVVSYIVRSIDSLLRSEFDLEDGLADTTTWGEMIRRHPHLTVPVGVSPEQDFVQILDPATGTGTFLVEIIEQIYKTVSEKWKVQGFSDYRVGVRWNEYVQQHLLPRLHGYELLMAPYAIAHLKIGLKLFEKGYRFESDERARVYLTNALEPARAVSGFFEFAIPTLAIEGKEVNTIKEDQRFTVIVGNPPYSGHSANKNDWIRDLLHGREEEQKVENYFEIEGAPLGESNPKWLNDDYVKFTRFGHWQIERTGHGVLGFITNHSYLDNPTFRGMRESLATTFSLAYFLDLHGNAKKGERMPTGGKDENIFDIQQGVAIEVLVKPVSPVAGGLLHFDLWGRRELADGSGKYEKLESGHVARTDWNRLTAMPPLRLFVPRDDDLYDEYQTGWSVKDVFPINSVGIVTARDRLTIQWSVQQMKRLIEDFDSCHPEEARITFGLGKDSRDWKVQLAQNDIRTNEGSIVSIQYRPFDSRVTYYTGKSRGFICRPRPKVMRHMLAGNNVGLVSCRQQSQVGVGWAHCGVTRSVIESCVISNKTKEICYLFPLYLYPQSHRGTEKTRSIEPNIDLSFVRQLISAIGLEFLTSGTGDLQDCFGPEDILHYVYAILHSPEYRDRYAAFLRSDFPRIPLPRGLSIFKNIVPLGCHLVNLHLFERLPYARYPSFPVAGNNHVERLRYSRRKGSQLGSLWINSKQYFGGLHLDTYAFTVGGYRPVQKWLRDRKGRILSEEHVAHYRNLVAILDETQHQMANIDEVIEKHGGWQNAFGLIGP